jgi:glycosyltransferase involved in cell wall biosynthesis
VAELDARPPAGGEPLRVAVVGISTRPTCGVRDHGRLLAGEMRAVGVESTMLWLSSEARTLAERRAEMRRWTGELREELARGRFDAVVMHYSSFSYSHRGIPLFVHPTLAALRGARLPLLAFMHEIVFPWRNGGLVGKLWAATQRIALVELVRDSSAIVVTVEFRADWLRSRRWLARRPVSVAPVFSNLPPSSAGPPAERSEPVVGIFGYALEPQSVRIVLDAIALLRRRSPPVRLALLGSPGRDSAIARNWEREAQTRGIDGSLSFSGVLAAQELADAMASCEVLLFASPSGAVSRKGTLAGALASGRPVIALEGRYSWPQLIGADAIATVARTPAALAAAVAELLDDRDRGEALGARGRRFAEQAMGLRRSAEIVREQLDQLLDRPWRRSPSDRTQAAGAGAPRG